MTTTSIDLFRVSVLTAAKTARCKRKNVTMIIKRNYLFYIKYNKRVVTIEYFFVNTNLKRFFFTLKNKPEYIYFRKKPPIVKIRNLDFKYRNIS